jgi:hypothetical protein
MKAVKMFNIANPLKEKVTAFKEMDKIKTSEELYKYLLEVRKNNLYCPKQLMFNLTTTNNIVKDFAKFTDLQSGKKSDDPNDPAAKFLPPKPYKDNRYYHTIRDITWQTFHTLKPELSEYYFYNMSDELRNYFIQHFMISGIKTSSDACNALLSYVNWGSGNCEKELELYKKWYKTDTVENIIESILFDRLTDIRIYRYSNMKPEKYRNGWIAGELNFWFLFRNYCKK